MDGDRVLLAHWVNPDGGGNWTLPGGRVEHGEDPIDTVVRELAEETGLDGVVERLLGVDSRVIVSAERHRGGPDLHNIGVFYELRVTGGELRPEPDGPTSESAWTRLDEVAGLVRSSLVDVGLDLARTRPPTGHVTPVPVSGRLRH
ncbi:DNA mismatch repair protein MutT [Paractinoplanes rishiriensis]|uniref:DNA mismatch repair protein MutT n=2 Tax=Paractinoplanes rishiriensis TaxID=1050105 RepID=A0A919MTM6_9ACTN|nr:DNA mismatch repair protein MutT [Actinoplanes rishiriensis]